MSRGRRPHWYQRRQSRSGLADPGLVQEPNLEPLGLGMSARDPGDQRGFLVVAEEGLEPPTHGL
jgi:hypothetical protein